MSQPTPCGEAVSAEIAAEELAYSIEELGQYEAKLRSIDPVMAGDLFLQARRFGEVLCRMSRRLAKVTTYPPQEWDGGKPGRTVMRWRGPNGAGLMLQDDGRLWLRDATGGPWRAWGRIDGPDTEVPEKVAATVPGGPWHLMQSGSFYAKVK